MSAPRRATSRYRQVRVQFTEEASGRCSWSLYVKPLGSEWSQQQCLARGVYEGAGRLASLDDVLRTCEDILAHLRRAEVPGIG